MQNPGASTVSWHMGQVGLGALPSFLMSEWVVCLVCRAGESMANGETSHLETQPSCDSSPAPAEPTSVQNVLLTAPLLKLSPGHMGFAVMGLSVLCDPEISDGHQKQG